MFLNGELERRKTERPSCESAYLVNDQTMIQLLRMLSMVKYSNDWHWNHCSFQFPQEMRTLLGVFAQKAGNRVQARSSAMCILMFSSQGEILSKVKPRTKHRHNWTNVIFTWLCNESNSSFSKEENVPLFLSGPKQKRKKKSFSEVHWS